MDRNDVARALRRVARTRSGRPSLRVASRGLPVLLLGACLAGVSPARSDLLVRVRIGSGAGSVPLSGSGLRADGRPVDGDATTAVPSGQNAVQAAGIRAEGPIRFEAAGGVSVLGARRPGFVTVVPDGAGSLDVVNVVPLETYVERVVTSEVYASWPAEALKAQAVVTRTYALWSRQRRRGRAFDLDASILSQRYGSRSVPDSVRSAVRDSAGEYLQYEREPILAAFHASAGGRTAASEEVWPEALPYLRTVDSPDTESPEHFWSYEIPLDALRRALEEAGLDTREDGETHVLERTASGRVARVALAGAVMSGPDLRRVLGGRAIKSALFEVRRNDDRVRFLGSGAGHGVGLSQWGARQMAVEGLRYREILLHYFTGARLAVIDRDAGSSLEARR